MNDINNLYKCILESPNGDTHIGYGVSAQDAYNKAFKNLETSQIPVKGPWFWEQQK